MGHKESDTTESLSTHARNTLQVHALYCSKCTESLESVASWSVNKKSQYTLVEKQCTLVKADVN